MAEEKKLENLKDMEEAVKQLERKDLVYVSNGKIGISHSVLKNFNNIEKKNLL